MAGRAAARYGISIAGCLAAALSIAGQAAANPALSDAAVRQEIIRASISAYAGNCPCPYSSASNGSRCGKRSAWSRAGGYAPICYPEAVTPEMIEQYRKHTPEK